MLKLAQHLDGHPERTNDIATRSGTNTRMRRKMYAVMPGPRVYSPERT